MSGDPEQQGKSADPELKSVSSELLVTLQEPPAEDMQAARDKIKNRTALMILELASHTLILGLALGSIWLVHLILETLFGKDAKFFDYIPISWIIDVADVLVIGKFLWEIIKDFRRD